MNEGILYCDKCDCAIHSCSCKTEVTMSNEEQMREKFDGFWARNNPGLNESHKVVAWAVFKSCAAIKDAEIAEVRKTAEYWKAEHLVGNKEIAARDLMIKELREALNDIARYDGISSTIPRIAAQQALTKSEHHNSRALEKALLEAEIRVLDLAYMKCSPYGEEFGFMLTDRKAKLAELNKE